MFEHAAWLGSQMLRTLTGAHFARRWSPADTEWWQAAGQSYTTPWEKGVRVSARNAVAVLASVQGHYFEHSTITIGPQLSGQKKKKGSILLTAELLLLCIKSIYIYTSLVGVAQNRVSEGLCSTTTIVFASYFSYYHCSLFLLLFNHCSIIPSLFNHYSIFLLCEWMNDGNDKPVSQHGSCCCHPEV